MLLLLRRSDLWQLQIGLLLMLLLLLACYSCSFSVTLNSFKDKRRIFSSVFDDNKNNSPLSLFSD